VFLSPPLPVPLSQQLYTLGALLPLDKLGRRVRRFIMVSRFSRVSWVRRVRRVGRNSGNSRS
jgi:hypothetical protein